MKHALLLEFSNHLFFKLQKGHCKDNIDGDAYTP